MSSSASTQFDKRRVERRAQKVPFLTDKPEMRERQQGDQDWW